MSRLGAALIKKHLAAVVGSRPVVVAAEPEQPPPQVEEPVPSARDAGESPPPVPQDGGLVPNGEAPSPVTEPEDPRVAAALEAAREQALALYAEARRRGEREGWEAG
ncbi:MAG: hypothetical protein AB1816_15650, partial [Bacillota bacterium]